MLAVGLDKMVQLLFTLFEPLFGTTLAHVNLVMNLITCMFHVLCVHELLSITQILLIHTVVSLTVCIIIIIIIIMATLLLYLCHALHQLPSIQKQLTGVC